MFRIKWDFGGVVYLLPNGSIEYDANDHATVKRLTAAEHRVLMTKGTFYGEVDKGTSTENTMVFLAWGP